MSNKIYISPSNQNGNTYAAGGTNEMEQCNKIAAALEVALKRCGFSTKRAPKGQAMSKSISDSNAWGADLHLPIHTNAFNGKVTGGTMIMIYNNATNNLKAAKAIKAALDPVTPGKDYAIQVRNDLAELSQTKAIAVYCECEFHDTAVGAKFIIDHTSEIAEAIAKGVCNFYGVRYIATSKDSDGDGIMYYVQIGAYRNKANADAQAAAAKAKGFSVCIKTSKDK